MKPFELIEDISKKILTGEKRGEDFYAALWQWVMVLNSEEKEKALRFSEQISKLSKLYHAMHIFSCGMACTFASEFQKAISFAAQALEEFVLLNEPGGCMASNCSLSISYKSMGQLDKAQHYVQESASFFKHLEKGNPYHYFQAINCYQSGDISLQLGDFNKAIECYNMGLSFISEVSELRGRLLSGLGVAYMHAKDFENSELNFNNALKTIEASQNYLLESKIYSDISYFYLRKGEVEKALENQLKSLHIREKNNLLNPACTSYISLAEIYLEKNDPDKSIEFAQKAIEIAHKLNTVIKLFEAHALISKAYEIKKMPTEAFEHFKKFHKYKEEVHSHEVMRKVEQLNAQHQIESSEQEKEIFRLRNVELKSALDEIKESFMYATRIQKAILPSDKNFEKYFPESFIIYKPKDIVAGDFYWMEEMNGEIFVAACDCTGHGVPGAMVSVVCHNALNRAIREFKKSDTAAILDKTRDLVIEEFEKSEEDVKDGMDVVLCGIRNKTLQFSGANNPLWIVNKNGLQEIKGNKTPVGKHVTKENFNKHTLQLESGDLIYLFSDGYADQFGGPNGKKFRYNALKELILANKNLSMNQQKELLNKNFESWKGELEQVDDVLIIGIKIW